MKIQQANYRNETMLHTKNQFQWLCKKKKNRSNENDTMSFLTKIVQYNIEIIKL